MWPSWSGSPRPRCWAPPRSTRCSSASLWAITSSTCAPTSPACCEGAKSCWSTWRPAWASIPAARPPTASSRSRTSSASRPAPRRRACRSTTATSTGSPTTRWTSCSKTCGRASGPTTCPATARSAGSASRSPRTAAPAWPRPTATSSRRGSPATPLLRRPERERACRANQKYSALLGPVGRSVIARSPGRGAPMSDGAGGTGKEIPRIVSSRWDLPDGHTLERYLDTGGYGSLRKALESMTPAQVHEDVKAASLLGRGGAGFPAGVKWGFCPPGVFPRYLVVNGDESEPGTYKDRILMERDPHQLIEGMLIACYAIGVSQAFLYVRGEMALAQERLAQALNDAYAAGYVGRNILGSDFSVDIVLHWGAGAYIVGEETALIESLEGERGLPRLKPPFFPAAKGLYMQPTVVNNVETLANLPWVIDHGGAGFADLGAESSRGTRLFAVSGHVNRPGVYEVEFGTTTFRDLLYGAEYGDGIVDGHRLKAFIPGGASAPWFFEEHLDMPLEAGAVGAAGSMLGSGAIRSEE